MNAKRTFRKIRRTALSLMATLRVLVMAFAVAFSPLGFSFSACHCLPCECSAAENVSCGCCTDSVVTTCCCSTGCCDHGESEDSECPIDCALCQCQCECDMGIAVDPVEMPAINDAAKPTLDTATEFVEQVHTLRSSSHHVDRYEVLLAQEFHALHCCWLI